MKFGVVVFPGSTCEDDMVHVLQNVMGQQTIKLWHKENDLKGLTRGDCIVLPGGFAYGDYLRAGAIARFSPILEAVIGFAQKGGFVWGIGNGFQVLCEAGLLPGILLENNPPKFICKNIFLKTLTNHSALTANILNKDMPLKIPIAHGRGRFYAEPSTIKELENNDQILFKYTDEYGVISEVANPDGSIQNIAAICNRQRNVFGMMPHPERASENILGNTDGKILFESLIHKATNLVG